LTDAEAHHGKDVLRLSSGAAVELFNGRGLVAEAVVQVVGRRELSCQVLSARTEPEPTPRVTLATAVPKGERFDWLVEKATELGVSRLIPLITERSSVDPRDSKLSRLRQTVIAACKQCRRAHLMELTEATRWQDFLKGAAGHSLFIAHPDGSQHSDIGNLMNPSGDANEVFLLVGPEGGFTAGEIDQATASGGRLVSLGQHLLRIETAGMLLASWVLLSRLVARGSARR